MKTCKQCNKEYTNRNVAFCSRKCMDDYNQQFLKDCKVCGKRCKGSKMVFCSRECREKTFKPKKVCAREGCNIMCKRAIYKYCSRDCRVRASKKNPELCRYCDKIIAKTVSGVCKTCISRKYRYVEDKYNLELVREQIIMNKRYCISHDCWYKSNCGQCIINEAKNSLDKRVCRVCSCELRKGKTICLACKKLEMIEKFG